MSAEIIISVRDLQKHFNAGEVHALNGVSVDIEKSEVLVVIGPSGSGKSTFLRCLNLLERPTAGSVIFEGTDITGPRVNINLHRRRMGMVFQHFNLFPHMTVLKNLTLGPTELLKKDPAKAKEKAMQRALLQWKRPENRPLVREALRQAGRTDLIGYGKQCLIRPERPARETNTRENGSARKRNAERTAAAGRKRDPGGAGGKTKTKKKSR